MQSAVTRRVQRRVVGSAQPAEHRCPAERFFDAQRLVPLGRSLPPGARADFQLPAAQPTARCTIVTSSVSPDRAETIVAHPAARAALSAACGFRNRPALVRFEQHGIARASRRRG